MEQVILILLGSFLAIIGGFTNQWYQYFTDRKKEDENILFQILNNLKKYLLEPYEKFDNDVISIVIKIRSKKFRSLSISLVKFALMDAPKNEDELTSLIKKTRESINKPLFDKIPEIVDYYGVPD
jgi:hypothetical protein